MNQSSSETLLEIIKNFPQANIAVFGDLMLDKYIWGKATRISQEAPVPVVLVNRETVVAGGAANVARNVMSLGAKANTFGIIGNDENGKQLFELLNQNQANTNGISTIKERPTTVKTRVIAANQQVVRIDQEVTDPIDSNYIEQLLQELETQIEAGEIKALILEDYAKGLLNPQTAERICKLCKAKNIPVSLDPHPTKRLDVKGLYLMTPNRLEAFSIANIPYSSSNGLIPEKDEKLLQVAKVIQEEWDVENLLITLGKDGMALFRKNLPIIHLPTQAQEVFDVSGAGDTVMATFMVSILAGSSLIEAMQIANEAAGIVVGKVGTCPVPLTELCNKISAKKI